MEAEERAQAGVFLAFQYPVEIPGVSNAYFLRAAYNEGRKARARRRSTRSTSSTSSRRRPRWSRWTRRSSTAR
jgi:Fe-S cluster assembly ATP-binding protein